MINVAEPDDLERAAANRRTGRLVIDKRRVGGPPYRRRPMP